MDRTRTITLLIVIALVVAFFALDLQNYLDFNYIKGQQARLNDLVQAQPVGTGLIFFSIYIAVTGLSLPGAGILTLAAGALFGIVWGTIIANIAATIGATIAFLISRYLFKDLLQERFKSRLAAVNRGIEKDGVSYLLILRLIPIFPFFVINIVMAWTPIKTRVFAPVTMAGMLPAAIIFTNAGTQLAQLESPSGIFSAPLLASFALLAIFPFVARKVIALLQRRRALRGFPRPRRFDRNMIVIGAGSAGLVAAYIATAVRAKVTLIEKARMGGDCLNTGCVPSKALLRSAKLVHMAKQARTLGLREVAVGYEFSEVMERVQSIVRRIAPHDSIERYTELGVECVDGEARITSPYTVEVDGHELTTRSIVLATGARPFVPPIPGIDTVDYLTSDTVWDLRELPERLIVLGGGPIGCELTQAFARLGSRVTQVEMADRLLVREDPEISQTILDVFATEGIDVRLNHRAVELRTVDGHKRLVCEQSDTLGKAPVEIPFDQVIVALGRRPNTEGYGLEELGIPLTAAGTIETNAYLQTSIPTIYACGDVAGPYQFTHTAAHQAWYATVNGLFGDFKRFSADYSVIPWCTFTDPEVARVGLSETEARERGIKHEVTTYPLDELDRAITDGVAHGVVKVITPPGKDTILGVTIVGEHAGDLIAEFVLAMKHNLGLNKILGTIHIYPTLAEANRFVAGQWRRAHAPQHLLRWAERFHTWRRGAGPARDKASATTDRN